MKGTFSFIAVSVSCIGCQFATTYRPRPTGSPCVCLDFSFRAAGFYKQATIFESVCAKKIKRAYCSTTPRYNYFVGELISRADVCFGPRKATIGSGADMCSALADVRFGSKADICSAKGM